MIILNEMNGPLVLTLATRKPGFGASLTGNLYFERKFFVGSSSVKSRTAGSFLR